MEHITLSGHSGAFSVTAAARRLLVSYLTDARLAVGPGPEGDETVRDIEMALGEQLRAALDSGLTSIDESMMTRILSQSGPVVSEHPFSNSRVPWLCRVEQGKWFGGLCLGLSIRSNLRLDWVRTFAILFLFLTGGLLGVAYLIAMIFVPRMETVEQYKTAITQSTGAASV